MEATQTDVEYPQPDGQADGTVDGIADGIMDLLDNPDPNSSGVVVPTTSAKVVEPEPEKEPEGEEPEEEDLYVLERKGEKVRKTKKEYDALAHMGLDYTVKMQALSEERNELAPFAGLASIIKSDPLKAQQIAAILSGQAPQAQPTKPQFDDPIEQLKWETKQETIAEMRREMAQAITPLHRQAALNQVRQQVQADPDYKEIHQQIIDMVQAQPPKIQKTLFLQLDQDPATYVEAFQHFKTQKATKPTTTEPPKPVKKETHAPILESGGVEVPTGIESKAKAERISKMKAKALRSGDPTAVADWLKASGAIDHLY